MKAPPQQSEVTRPEEIFISYSRKDKEFVRRLDSELKRRGREAWVDWEGIRPTEEFMKAIFAAIQQADTFVFVLSPDSVVSQVCGREIGHAASHNKRIVPIVAREIEASAVPETIAKLNWIFCREIDDFAAAIDQLVTALETDLDWIHSHTRLLTRALDWQAGRKSRSFVLHGEDLRAAEQWLTQAGADKERQPTALQTEYIIASRKAAARTQRLITGGVSAALLVSIGLTIFALQQTRRAIAQRDETQRVLSLSDLANAQERLVADQAPTGLAFLARAVGNYSKGSGVASDRLWFALTQRAWPLPLSTSMRHKGAIVAATFSPDGQRVLTASRDFSARLWDASTGQPIGEPLLHPKVVGCAAFSPNGRQIVTGCDDAQLRLWDIGTTGCVRRWSGEHQDRISAVAFGPHSNLVASGSQDHTLAVWDVATGKRVFSVRDEENVHTITFHPADEQLLVSVSGTAAHVWNVAQQRELFALSHKEPINSARFDGTGARIITASDDGTVRIWNAGNGEVIGQPLPHEGPVEKAFFSPDDQLIATISGDEAFLWKGADRRVLRAHKKVTCARFTRDSSQLITGTADGRAQSWNVFNAEPLGEPVREEQAIVSLDPAPDGASLLVASGNNAARVWQLPTVHPAGDLLRHGTAIEAIAASEQGDLLLTAGNDGKAKLWDMSKRTPFAFLDHNSTILCAAISPDGKHVATGGVNERVRVWQAASGKSVGQPLLHDGMIHRVQFSPDSQSLVVATETGVAQQWSLPDLHPLGEAMSHGDKITSVCFSRDGARILTTSWDKTAKLWKARTGQNIATLSQGDRELECGAFSPNGNCIATGSRNGSVQLWTLSGKAIRNPLWHRDEISALTFSPDGKRLATASADGQVVIWNPDNSQSVAEIWPSSTRITVLAFSPNCSRIATGGDDGQVRVWDVETGEPVTEWFIHTGSIRGLFFQGDGRLLDSVSADGAIRIWDILTPSSPSERKALARFALTISSARLQNSNRVEWHPLGTIDELRTQAREFDLGAVGVLTRWWFANPTERLITPFATITVPQYIAARLAEASPDSLREATLLAGGNPTLRAAIERASSR